MFKFARAAVTAALLSALVACGSTGKASDAKDDQPPTVDAEDYNLGPATVVAKRVDEAVKKKSGCKKKYTSGSKKGRCKTWSYKETDDKDWLLLVKRADGTQTWVDVDQATHDSYNLTDADTAADAYPRS